MGESKLASMKWGKRLRNWRVFRGLGQKELADKAGQNLGKQHLSNYETGRNEPQTAEIREALYKALGVSEEEFYAKRWDDGKASPKIAPRFEFTQIPQKYELMLRVVVEVLSAKQVD